MKPFIQLNANSQVIIVSNIVIYVMTCDHRVKTRQYITRIFIVNKCRSKHSAYRKCLHRSFERNQIVFILFLFSKTVVVYTRLFVRCTWKYSIFDDENYFYCDTSVFINEGSKTFSTWKPEVNADDVLWGKEDESICSKSLQRRLQRGFPRRCV